MKRIYSFGAIFIAALFCIMCCTSGAEAKKAKPSAPKAEKETAQEKKQSAGSWQPELRIGLLSGLPEASFRVNVPGVLQESPSEKRISFLSPGNTLRVSLKGGKLTANGKKISGNSITLRPQEKKPLWEMQTVINGKTYCGGAEIRLINGTLTVIGLVSAEDYLRCVLPEEMPVDWPEEALKAQAVAARTFALKNRKRHEREGYDLCNSTHCQVYGGIASISPSTDKAVKATFGECLFYKGNLIDAVFHSDSGGMTENCKDVWGTDVPYLRAVRESRSETKPWNVQYSVDEFSGILVKAGHNVGTVKELKLSKLHVGKGASDRSPSGRVKKLKIVGSKGHAEVTGNDLRSILGLKSTLFDVNLNKKTITISGYGWGHGIGLSQWGAKELSSKSSCKGILSHYYPGTETKKLY